MIESTCKCAECKVIKVRRTNILETQEIDNGITETNRSDYPFPEIPAWSLLLFLQVAKFCSTLCYFGSM